MDTNTSSEAQVAAACATCPLRRTCGGIEHDARLTCRERCERCNPATCDNVCFLSPRFTDAIREVDGFGADALTVGGPSVRLPRFLPAVHHKQVIDDESTMSCVAVPMQTLFRVDRSTGTVRGRFADTNAPDLFLRRAFNLRDDVDMVVVGPGHDRFIESFWANRAIMALDKYLASLRLSAVIVPNYSVWLDDPRVHHLYNRKRSLIVATTMSQQGVPVVPFAVGLTHTDWRFWEHVYRANPRLEVVAKEFQTGLANPEKAQIALDEAAWMQDAIGRDLHFVAIGGHHLAAEIAKRFSMWTVIDSTPYMKAVLYQRAYSYENKVTWHRKADGHVPTLFRESAALREQALDRIAANSKAPGSFLRAGQTNRGTVPSQQTH